MITCNLGLNQRAVLRYGGQIGFGLLLGCVSMGGIAQNQPPSFGGNQTSVQYQPNQYCPANTVVEIPQGTPNATLYRDSVCIREQLRPYQVPMINLPPYATTPTKPTHGWRMRTMKPVSTARQQQEQTP
ncbi:hypothetical protein [Faucicola atlantae]|uniref:hypothetical protein n=1 Tax=Faucicola atlantae TaxID=34059 RepID=UPI0025B06600|nr:hypothetical protein [Moraxella atlantae]